MMYNQYKPKGICIFHIVRWAPKQVRCYIYTQTLYPVLKSDEEIIFTKLNVYFFCIYCWAVTLFYMLSQTLNPILKCDEELM